MGLDMYLSAKRYLWGNNKEEKKTAKKIRELMNIEFDSGNTNYTEVTIEVGYWRKDNHIHKWFVDNVQDGEDNCSSYYVNREDLIKLKSLCNTIATKFKNLPTKKKKINVGFANGKNIYSPIKVYVITQDIEKLLPTESGFFFGSTEYDERYVNNLKRTIKIINKCLKLPKDWEFEYQSSW